MMLKRNPKLKKEVWSQFDKMTCIFLATCAGKKPRVRPVTMLHIENKLWVTTGTRDAKTKQLRKNSNMEFSVMVEKHKYQGSIRCAGKARLVRDMKTKRMLAKSVPFFKQFWKDASDPNFALLQLDIKSVEYMRPGEMQITRFAV
jgi:uncharacterized pyridoxamine 5'-phosphate oxidase family protein